MIDFHLTLSVMSMSETKASSNKNPDRLASGDKVVCFVLADQPFAIPIHQVKETVSMRPLTRVFLTPAFVLGVINLRGEIVAVLDLARLIGLDSLIPDAGSRIIIVKAKNRRFGVLVTAMAGVKPCELDKVGDAQALLGHAPDWIRGVTGTGPSRTTVMDMERLLDSEPLRHLLGLDEQG